MSSRRATGASLLVIAVATTVLAGPREPAAAAAPTPGDCSPAGSLERAHFPRHPDIDNRWFPLHPGARFELSGTVTEDGTVHTHGITTTVTGLTKMLDGVRTVVLLEQDFDDGELQESELAFLAEDGRGRVWNVGEYPEEYADGTLEGAPSTWISGIDGARAGIGMLGHPGPGTPAYLQGVAPSVEFRDCGQVSRPVHRLCVPTGCYRNVLVVKEWAPLEPEGGVQLKYYARGVGTVMVEAVGGDAPENLRLTGVHRLSRHDLAAANAVALHQDARGYRVSPDVYGRTARAVSSHR
jgi:hypothetical protein